MKIDLKSFCAYKGMTPRRKYIESPWSEGDYTYATDGRIIVRIPRDRNIPENGDCPDAERLFKQVNKEGVYKSIPHLPKKDKAGPNKKGFTEKTEFQKATFDNYYLNLIASLPNAQMVANDKEGAAHFKFDGGDGLLMPMRI